MNRPRTNSVRLLGILVCSSSAAVMSGLMPVTYARSAAIGNNVVIRRQWTINVCRLRDRRFDAYETNGEFHVQSARPQLRDLARRVRRRPPPGTEGPTRRGW